MSNTNQISDLIPATEDVISLPVKVKSNRGRKKKDVTLKPVSINMPPTDNERVKVAAQELGVSPNALMRYFVLYGIEQLEQKKIAIPLRKTQEIAF